MMLRFCATVILLKLPMLAWGQHEIDSTERLYKEVLHKLPQLAVRQIVKQNENGSVDTIKFYSQGEQIVYIYQHTYQDALSYGEGVPIADIHILKEFFLIKGKMRFFRLKSVNDKYINYRKNTQFIVEGTEVYFNYKGKCVLFRVSEPEEITNKPFIEVKNKAMIMKSKNCLYSPYRQEDVVALFEIMDKR